MKRVYVMLTSIAVLAGVGGAFAFKANAVRSLPFCISSKVFVAGVITCTFTTVGRITNSAVALTYATVFPAGVTKCTLANGGNGVLCKLTSFIPFE